MKKVFKVEYGNYGIRLSYDEGAVQPWVTHQFNSKNAITSGRFTEGYYWGHYFSESVDAVIDFQKRYNNISHVDLAASLLDELRAAVIKTKFPPIKGAISCF